METSSDHLASEPVSEPPAEVVSKSVPQASAEPAGTGREALTNRLLDIVRQRTGYPPDMLGLDLDLEADLGIDSIKRVEILGSLADGNGEGLLINQEMEKLTGLKTLRGIIDCLARTEAPIASAKPQQSNRELLTARLLDIVRQRTGYPPEMLGLDLDLEADLGIDSIKRVEILGSLAEGNGDGSLLNQEMEKLTGFKTLRGIIDCLTQTDECVNNATMRHHGNGHAGGSKPATSHHTQREGIQRMLVQSRDAPLPEPAIPALPAGALVITDDGRGIAPKLAQQLHELDRNCVVLRMGTGTPVQIGPALFEADMTCPEAVEDLLRQVRQQVGPVAGLIHLLPLAEPPAGEDWIARMCREVKSLFLLARDLADELCRSARNGGAVLLAATSLGSGTDDFFPGSGGVGGVVKSVAHEWQEVLVRVVDLDGLSLRQSAAAELAARLLAELGDAEGPIELGYVGTRRPTPVCVPAPLNLSIAPTLRLDKGATILVTGGARGITAAVALELARRYQPNLVLVGRSPLPETAEAAETASLVSAADLKAALIARLRREGRTATPAATETAYHRVLQDREIRTNLGRLKEAGARVHYYQADVRDEQAFAAVLDEVDRRFGGIEGVIHGAGVIQDKLIRDKTPESYERVFGTKVESALILSRHLRPEKLKFCAFFASVAGRFGNRGQTDYAAANEVLSKLAVFLDQRWPARVVSIAWGPWSGIGMVSELEEHLAQRGLQLIPPTVGPQFLHEELSHGCKGECEVVIAGEVGQLALRKSNAVATARS
jgi:NAD(P)-dependent dehydrogenase (short-subunit alcohol dehydrogenase family)/acyl carrier protein